METRQYSKRREMVDWAQIVPLLGQSTLICVPLSIVPILRKFCHTRAKWRTTYVKSYISTQTYEIPTLAEFNALEADIDLFLEETNDMAECQQITTELANIVAKLSDIEAKLNTQNTILTAMDFSGLSNLANIPVAEDFNDIEEQLNEIVQQMGGDPVTLS